MKRNPSFTRLARLPLPDSWKAWLARNGRAAFWVWVVYQAIKGILTTSLIWVPLILATCHFGGK